MFFSVGPLVAPLRETSAVRWQEAEAVDTSIAKSSARLPAARFELGQNGHTHMPVLAANSTGRHGNARWPLGTAAPRE